MRVAHWTLADIPWDRFDPAKVEPAILCLAKAASLVEQNGADYTRYLCNVFADDAEFQQAARVWGEEEIRHGEALGRWATLADPTFDHRAACARFSAEFRVDLAAARSIRGSRAGELVARCIVETGTSSHYTALAEATREPVLRAICHRIAADELRHYKLFYTHMKRYLASERLPLWNRLRIALGRIRESGDDELSYAYFVANAAAGAAYDRRSAHRDYLAAAARVYCPHHVERAVAMTFKAVGLKPHGRLNLLASDLAWRALRRRAAV
ncbi:MAG: ferritin-like domain-containing protein [Alphaproteobacteria bacterium]|nr:ferritin-like domain-containing protein [Alphaproteobacteria bacterium]